jgi:prevent-host-death family protein
MTTKVTATEAKARLLGLLDVVAQGEVIEITKRGRPVARLVPAAGPHGLKGMFAGLAMSVVSDDQLFSTGQQWNVDDDAPAR